MTDLMISEVEPSNSRGSFRLGAVLSRFTLMMLTAFFALAHYAALKEEFRLSLALIVVFEGLLVLMIATRRDFSSVDLRPLAVLAGLIGSFAPLLLRPVAGAEDLLAGQLLQILGTLLQVGAALSLGRSFGLVPANRGIKSGGMFRLVRHPFYFAYIVGQTGYLISNFSTKNAAVILMGTTFQVVRIRYEEGLLLESEEYQNYAENVRWHLVPGLW